MNSASSFGEFFVISGTELAKKRPPMRSYRFIDWATQVFLGAVTLLLLVALARGGDPRLAGTLLAAQITAALAVHGLIRWDASGRAPALISFLRHYYPILLYTGFFRETEWINQLLGLTRLDPHLIGWEQSLFGTQPSIRWMQLAPQPWVSEVLYASYFSFYLMIAGLGLWFWWKQPAVFPRFVAVVSFVFYCCYLLYMVVPVVGPRVFFDPSPERELFLQLSGGVAPTGYPEAVQKGPFHLLMKLIYRNFEARSAAFPSSHVAIALTTLWFSWRYLRPIRWIHAFVVVLLCLSTVYCRYHYLVDVGAGILTAALLAPLGNWLYCYFEPCPAEACPADKPLPSRAASPPRPLPTLVPQGPAER
jgi:membrane-associated phospholipid phosphatase